MRDAINDHASLVAKPRPSKSCSRCHLEKYLEFFYPHPRNKTDGRRADCKQCFKKARIKR